MMYVRDYKHYALLKNNVIKAFVAINVSKISSSSSLLMSDVTHDPPIPVPIRVGDLSLDGFPDLILIVATPVGGGLLGIGGDFHKTPVVLSSVSCSQGILGCSASGQGRRGFVHLDSGVEALQAIEDARGVAVLDLDEDVSCPFFSKKKKY
jgi:integrin alpha FG-GAP repeat containing protein 1